MNKNFHYSPNVGSLGVGLLKRGEGSERGEGSGLVSRILTQSRGRGVRTSIADFNTIKQPFVPEIESDPHDLPPSAPQL